MSKVTMYLADVDKIGTANAATNEVFIDVVGNKTDLASDTASQASLVALVRYIISIINSDVDVAALVGALNTASHTGIADNVTTLMGYLKQAITDTTAMKGAGYTNENLTAIDANIDGIITDIGNPAGHNLTSITSKIGNIARSLDLMLGSKWDSSGDLGTDISTIISSLGATAVISGTADSGTVGTLVDAALTQADDYFKGMVLVMTSGLNTGLARTVVDFVASSNTILVEPDFDNVIGTDTYTILPRTGFSDILIGNNNANNTADTSLVVANGNGSLLERQEFIQDAISVIDKFHDVPVANIADNLVISDVIGNKTDAAATGAVSAVESLMAYAKQNVTNTETSTTALTIIDAFHDVPAANAVDNTVMSDVVGNKTDEAATGAVSTVESLMSYSKQLITEGIARDVAIGVIDGLFDVPSEDLVTDVTMNQVIGKKSDTIAGTSLVSITKQNAAALAVIDEFQDVPAANNILNAQINEVIGNKIDTASTGAVTATDTIVAYTKQIVTEGIARDAVIANEVTKTLAGLTQTTTVTTVDASITPWTVAAHRLFTITGVVEIDKIFAVVDETVVEGAGLDNTCSVGTSDDVDLMIGVTVGDALVINDLWSSVSGSSLSKNALITNSESFLINSTDIDINVLGTNSITDGTLTFYCTWKPISVGATLVAASWD